MISDNQSLFVSAGHAGEHPTYVEKASVQRAYHLDVETPLSRDHATKHRRKDNRMSQQRCLGLHSCGGGRAKEAADIAHSHRRDLAVWLVWFQHVPEHPVTNKRRRKEEQERMRLMNGGQSKFQIAPSEQLTRQKCPRWHSKAAGVPVIRPDRKEKG